MVNCSWMAYLPGSYKIIIRYGGEEIEGSPFTCSITESEQGLQILERQLAKINCTGQGLQFGLVNEPNEVRVNEVNGNYHSGRGVSTVSKLGLNLNNFCRTGMIGGLRVAMEGPGKSVISFRTNPDDENESLSMFYQVPNPGDYSLIIK